MKILFFGTKPYDKTSFEDKLNSFKDLDVTFVESELDSNTVLLARGFDAVCVFVNTTIDKSLMEKLVKLGIKLILLRCAGFNNVDKIAAKEFGITIMRVPSYSPEAVAEMAMTLAMAVNRKVHKAYIKVRENNFALTGLTGLNFHGKTVGIIGTGKIGVAMANICKGFGMNVIAYDKFPNPTLDLNYVSLDELYEKSDLISLHCPLTKDTHHMINSKSISKMKDGVILVNTSRGGLIKTEDLIQGIRNKKFFGVCLDVYEEEDDYVFENLEDDILLHSITARLLSFPNVIVTSHQGFLTQEALEAIALTTLQNAQSFKDKNPLMENII